MFLIPNFTFAEGQGGLQTLVDSIVLFVSFFNCIVYTLVGYLLLRLVFKYNYYNTKYRRWIFIGIPFLITLLLTIVFQDKFIFSIYNMF